MARLPVLAAAAALTLGAVASPALAARLAPSVTAAPRGSTILLVGTGFAPPNEFCRRPTLRIDGKPARVTGRLFDDAGGWSMRVLLTQPPGRRIAVMRQVCESGRDGSLHATVARAGFRVFR